jgi:hypothetical protein
VQPKLDLIGQCLTRDLGRRYGPDVALSFPDCSPRNADQRRKDDETDARLGLRTVNEIRRGRGLEPYPDARFDVPFALDVTPPTPARGSTPGYTPTPSGLSKQRRPSAPHRRSAGSSACGALTSRPRSSVTAR